ncbi:exosortase A [Yunchengibacter salinarum]|uniref:exosortase A n=1 Tax=Yunchengibacter salinarum TaxID=3133399 RepID=UPI0035B65209
MTDGMTMRYDWARGLWFLGLLVLLVLIVWRDTLVHMVGLWLTRDLHSYGLAVPFMAGWMAWLRRPWLIRVKPAPGGGGLALLALALVLLATARGMDARLPAHISLVLACQGVVWAALGPRAARILLVPLLFLFLMVPVRTGIVTPLQHLTAEWVIGALRFSGFNPIVDAMLIRLPGGLYEVAEACAGVRFLYTSVVIGLFLADLAVTRPMKRVALVLAGLGVPILANGVRVYGLILLGEAAGQDAMKGVDHLIYGWAFLSLVLLAMVAVALWMRDRDALLFRPPCDLALPPSRRVSPWPLIGLVTLLALGALTLPDWPVPMLGPPGFDWSFLGGG